MKSKKIIHRNNYIGMNDRYSWSKTLSKENSIIWRNQFRPSLGNQLWKSLLMFLRSLVALLLNGYKAVKN